MSWLASSIEKILLRMPSMHLLPATPRDQRRGETTLSSRPRPLQPERESATLARMAFDHPISRRRFLRRGALLTAALAGGLPTVPWIPGSREAEGAIMGIGQELRDVLNEETVNRILQEALARGGEFADVFAEQRFRTGIVLEGGAIDSVTYGFPRGAGVRVVRRNQTGYAFSDQITYASLLDAARVASAVIENQSQTTPIDVTRRELRPPFSLNGPFPLEDEPIKFDFVRRMDAAARSVDPR